MIAPLLRWTTSALFFAAAVSFLTILVGCGGESPDAGQDRAPREIVPSTEAADPTPEPTATLEPTPTAEPTATPEPTLTTEPMATPEPSPTMAPTATPSPTDREILELFYHATDGPNWANNENWLSDNPLGEWYGVTTNADGRVTELILAGIGLSGELHLEVGSLALLTVLNLTENNLEGEFPPELSNLSQLTVLDLWGNSYTGDIPMLLGDLSNLESLNIGENDWSGSIPAALGKLSSLKSLVIAQT